MQKTGSQDKAQTDQEPRTTTRRPGTQKGTRKDRAKRAAPEEKETGAGTRQDQAGRTAPEDKETGAASQNRARTGHPDRFTFRFLGAPVLGSGPILFLLGSGVGARSSHEHREGDSTTTVGALHLPGDSTTTVVFEKSCRGAPLLWTRPRQE